MGTKHTPGNNMLGRLFIGSENITQFTLTPTCYGSCLAPVAFSVCSSILLIIKNSLFILHNFSSGCCFALTKNLFVIHVSHKVHKCRVSFCHPAHEHLSKPAVI